MAEKVNDPSERELRLDEAIASFYQAREAGQALDRNAFLACYPDLADELAAFLDNKAAFEKRAGGSPSPASEAATLGPTPTQPAPAPLEKVGYFGDYELLAEIARGGMGVVYRARQVSLNRTVALKMILAGQLASPADVQRFHTEAEAAANLDHPNIVPIYEVGEYEGQHYFSMKLVEGGSLGDCVERFRSNAPAVARLLQTVARAVHYAHQRGILHRDLKPANILLDAKGEPHVTDFGLAKRVEGGSNLTQSGAIVGTPAYMAPEQARAEKGLSTAVDTYSLGAILYELLTGRPPFRAATALDTILQVLDREPEPPSKIDARVDRDLETICLKCLEKDPAKRYGSAEALADDLERWQRGEPIQARRTGVLERTWKWARRRPGLALMTGGVLAFVLLSVLLGAGYAITAGSLRESEAQRELEKRLRDQAEQGEATEKELRQRAERANESAAAALYINRIIRAQFEWKSMAVGRAERLLDECPPQLRGWEWHYVKRLCHPEALTLTGHAGPVMSVCFSPDGKRLASGSLDKTIKVWDAATGQVVHTLTGHTEPVVRVCFSPDGKRLASASLDKTVRIWDAATGQLIRTLEGHANIVMSVCFSPDGKRLASTSISQGNGKVRVWDAATGQEVFALTGRDGFLAACFSPDGKRLAAAPVAGPVKLWDAETGKEAISFKGGVGMGGFCTCVCFSPDGKQLATGSSYFMVNVWDAGTGEIALTLNGHTGGVISVCFSPDGKQLASAAGDKTVRVWDATTGQPVRTIEPATTVSSVCFSPDGTRLASGTEDQTVKVWPAAAPREALTLMGHKESVRSVCFSPDGKQLASVSSKTTVSVWDAATGQEVVTIKGQTDFGWIVCFGGDGKRLFTMGKDKTIRVWNAATGQEIQSVPGPDSARRFSPDGKWLASASRDGTVKLWDTATGQAVRTLQGRTQNLRGLWFSPDGQRLATAASDHRITLWDVATGQMERTFQGHTSFINSVCFSPDGRRLASASQDGTAKVWDTATGLVVHNLTGHNAIVAGVCFSPDGRRLATSSQDETVKLWDTATGQETLTLKGHTGVVMSVCFSPDGHRLASESLDGTVRVWDATPLREPRQD
jgi:WD40 repeat protein/predicted Ser/Thr protein kinase